MTKFHINTKGEPGSCSATINSCPYGGPNEHYDSKETARSAYEKTMAEVTFSKANRAIMGVTVPERFYHLTPRRNLEAIRANGLQPTIGERSENLGELEPRIYLFDSEESVNDALGNWLGEEFDEDEDLVLLSIPASALENPVPSFPGDESSWEWSNTGVIDSSWLTEEPGEY
jgi:hypothetical protein